MMKVLVTGAAGRLGSSVCRALCDAGGFDVRATDRRLLTDSPTPIQVVNLLDREACYALVQGVDAVVHLGNHPSPYSIDPQQVFAENNAMNVNVFQAAVESGVRTMIFASSIQVVMGTRHYRETGEQLPSALPYLPIDGQTPPNPSNTYGVSKRCGEMLLEMYTRVNGISGTAIRFPWMDSRKHFSRWIAQRPAILDPWRMLDEALSYLSVEDAGRLLIAILLRPRPGFTICQPGGPTAVLPLDAREIQRLYPNVPLHRPAEQLRALVDLDILEQQFGWKPQDDLYASVAPGDDKRTVA